VANAIDTRPLLLSITPTFAERVTLLTLRPMLKLKYTETLKGTEPEAYFHDELHDRKYEMVLGGMAWPTVGSGSAVIVARQFDSDHLWIVADCEQDLPGTFKFMSLAAKRWFCFKWFGNGFDEAYLQFMHSWNRKHDKRTKVHLIDAPFVEEQNAVAVYFQLIKETASKLHDATDSDYSGKLDSVAEDLKVEKSQGGHYVSVLALGYALAAFKIYGHSEAQFTDVGYEPLDEMSAI